MLLCGARYIYLSIYTFSVTGRDTAFSVSYFLRFSEDEKAWAGSPSSVSSQRLVGTTSEKERMQPEVSESAAPGRVNAKAGATKCGEPTHFTIINYKNSRNKKRRRAS